ncbi:unnamed protein product [Pieris macdunnoughi]|uniref:Uncharacterized protein n=1 Tax=Pieris macdunnoughi TaxID=345717 RepID=A0A821W3J6_9NEOP|nr:unnamed protein product [Pieris macdunnoughi]
MSVQQMHQGFQKHEDKLTIMQVRAGLHPNAMIHIIRFAGELNVFHYCHSSEEVGGAGRRRFTPARFRGSVAGRHSRC